MKYEVVIQSKSVFFKNEEDADGFVVKVQKLLGNDTEMFLNEIMELVEVEQKVAHTKVKQIKKFPNKEV